MATAGGPNIETDGLVFGYDTGYGAADNSTSTKFYPGEPTENLIYDMGGTVTQSFPEVVYRSTALETNVTDSTAPGGVYSRFTGIDDQNNNQLYSRFSSYGIDVTNQSVNYSVYLKGSGTCHLTIYDNQQGYGTSSTITLTDKWTRYNYTRTVHTSATAYWVAVRGILSTTNVYIAGQQATRGTRAAPYVENNRSSTQSLIDLTRTTDIDVSNISFDSTGQPTFDGTDDNINLEDVLDMGTGNLTIEAVFKRTSNSSTSQWIMSKSYAGGAISRYWVDNYWDSGNSVYKLRFGASWNSSGHTDYLGNQTLNLNQWYHICVVVDRDDKVFLYIDGELDASHNISAHSEHDSNSLFPYRIGSYTAGDQTSPYGLLSGLIPVYKHYNRALSAQEVQQNYNAYKNRFDI